MPMTSWLTRVLRWTRPRPPVPAPAVVLEAQRTLSRLDREIAALSGDDNTGFARAHHLRAAVAAYGEALDEACRLAGVPPTDADGDLRRVLAEVELRVRGWDW